MPRKANETKIKEVKEKTIDIKKIEIELNQYLEDRKEDITKELANKIDEQIEAKVAKRLKEEEKKINRGKTAKIIWRDIIIIMLLALIGYFGYCLYDVDYFNIRTKVVDKPSEKQPNEEENNNNENENKDPVIDDKPNSEYYIKNYSYLLDRLLIEDDSIYELFNKKITKESISNDLIQKIAYKNIDKMLMTTNNGMITFHENSLLESAKNIFGENVSIKNEMFNYNNTKFMYYSEAYIGLKEEENKSNIITEIIDAKEEEKMLTFDIIVTKLSNENALLDLDDNVLLEKYNNEDIAEYKDSIPKYKITFEKEQENYIFSSIEKAN